MKLVDVYSEQEKALHILYVLLGERVATQSISHKKMPLYEEHIRFVQSRPYLHWYLIENESGGIAGAVYLTKKREIGIGILNYFRCKGYALMAIQQLMDKHPGVFFANINPLNEASISLFTKLGFNELQRTYAKS